MDSAELREVIDVLLDDWKRTVAVGGPTHSDWQKRSPAQVTTILALTAHIHQTALLLQSALPDELTLAHMPLVRSVFECTITVVWCDEVADGAHALINEGARQRRALRTSLSKTRSLSDLAYQINVGHGVLPTSSIDQIRVREKRCTEVGLDGAYAFYRMLSGMSHASIGAIDGYLDEKSFESGAPISVMTNPGALASSFGWSHLVASCLV